MGDCSGATHHSQVHTAMQAGSSSANAAPPSVPSTRPPTHLPTPIGLVNNGVHVTDGNTPSIWTVDPFQMLQLPTHQPAPMRVPASGPSPEEKIFGCSKDARFGTETTTHELGRLEIVTMRQLQRALQHKITQNTRNPSGYWAAFHKLDRRGVQHLNLDDLIAAVRGFNLVASPELIKQLLHAIDSDHDGVLSLSEFVAGLQSDNRSTLQLQPETQHGVSSRRHFRAIKFHHPLHNVAHMSAYHQFEDNLAGRQ
uniref:EF-hand domain-containing protein n=1 Tax=Haptolina brevifila TaxID=156173 RepID=A0A7S2DQ13_9EUKA|eukprot:CAMPEP_0174725464 /NCGR_PEP_ID=MMETSP1094-20130205/45647_1 /TAXON_ID=156173 /ORGANISM="Chrysochromulina brevifilum, Strain UTEX LB 985" /LENGTH=253 /DNA_ID=CAMNT_0015926871 /DNA_START=19 /DNA_END=780 /DNA_ORIENTATION=+